MNWRTGARLALAAVGLGVAATVIILGRRGPEPAKPPPELAKIDPTAALAGGAGEYIHIEDGAPVFKITFAASREYDDGRMLFESAAIVGLAENQSRLRADRLEATRKTAQDRYDHFNLSGNVVLEADDGLRVETSRATYAGATSVVTMPEEVIFTRGRLSGTSTGATFDRAQDVITLLESARARVAPGANGRGGAEATARRMRLVRGQHSLMLEENARIVGETETLTAQNATFVFTEDEQAVKYLELRGAARVEPAAGAANRPAMSGDAITMSFHADGLTLQHATLTGRAVLTTTDAGVKREIRASWIDLFTAADGRTLTKLQARDRVVVDLPATAKSAGRTITAATLQASGHDTRGLQTAQFDGAPRFEETPPAPARGATPRAARVGTASVLVLTLAGQLDAIERAEFQQNARFENGDVTAFADLAKYDQNKNILLLTPHAREPRKLSRVTTSAMVVDAQEIDLFLDTENLNARGAVTTRTARSAAATTDGALFSGSDPVYGSADALEYRRDRRAAVYTGAARRPARLKQGQTDIAAARIEYAEATGDLTATGGVDSTLHIAVGADKGQLQPHRVVAETLSYDDQRRTAVYRGTPVKATASDGETEARQITFELASASRALQRMRAEQDVFATLPGGEEALGTVLVYDAGTDIYTLTGTPARAKARDKGAPGAPVTRDVCRQTTSLTIEINRRTGSVRVPGQGQTLSTTEEVACSLPLRSRK